MCNIWRLRNRLIWSNLLESTILEASSSLCWMKLFCQTLCDIYKSYDNMLMVFSLSFPGKARHRIHSKKIQIWQFNHCKLKHDLSKSTSSMIFNNLPKFDDFFYIGTPFEKAFLSLSFSFASGIFFVRIFFSLLSSSMFTLNKSAFFSST